MSNIQMKVKYCKISDEQKLLILQTRLALQSDFRICLNNSKQKSELWKRIHQQLREQDSSMKHLTLQKIRSSYKTSFASYKIMKTTGKFEGTTLKREIYDIFEQTFANDQSLGSSSQDALRNDIYQLVLNARLSRESEFQNNDHIERKLLWQKILEEVKAKAVGCTVSLTSRRIQNIFANMLSSYRRKRKKNSKHVSSCPYFDQIDQIYGHNEMKSVTREVFNSYDNLKQLVLNARLCREAEFSKFKKYTIGPKLLWQEILEEVKAKAIGYTKEITIRQIQHIFWNLFHTYKKKTHQKKGILWPYFDQLDKVYGDADNKLKWKNDSIEYKKLEKIVLTARLTREVEFQKYSTRERKKLWQQMLCEVKAKAANCHSVQLNSYRIQQIFGNMLRKYKKHKSNGNRSWQHFAEMDKVYGNCKTFEIFTMNSDSENDQCNEDSITVTRPTLSVVAIIPAMAKMTKFLKQTAFSERKIFQKICDIEKNNLQLQRAEIDELQKLIILLEKKKGIK